MMLARGWARGQIAAGHRKSRLGDRVTVGMWWLGLNNVYEWRGLLETSFVWYTPCTRTVIDEMPLH